MDANLYSWCDDRGHCPAIIALYNIIEQKSKIKINCQ